MALLVACGDEERPTAPAIRNRDSLPIMSTTGVSKLISDSGIIKYKIVAETWDVYDKTKPQRQGSSTVSSWRSLTRTTRWRCI